MQIYASGSIVTFCSWRGKLEREFLGVGRVISSVCGSKDHVQYYVLCMRLNKLQYDWFFPQELRFVC